MPHPCESKLKPSFHVGVDEQGVKAARPLRACRLAEIKSRRLGRRQRARTKGQQAQEGSRELDKDGRWVEDALPGRRGIDTAGCKWAKEATSVEERTPPTALFEIWDVVCGFLKKIANSGGVVVWPENLSTELL